MMRFLLYATLFFAPLLSTAQSYNITKWSRNTTGKVGSYYFNNGGMPITYTWTVSTDSADVLKVAYSTDSVWVRSNGLTDSMGKYLNPGGCLAQGYTHRFPRATSVPATKTISPKGGSIGLLLNGIPIYGLGNSTSYTGSGNANSGLGVWNVEVGKSEGFVLDANYGAHPQQQGGYHSHDKPYRMYRDSGTTKHSPIIGYAFDGYPVYGPYGYATAMSATSGIARMKTGYSLRNITTRTTLPAIPNGGGAASQTGPAVSTTYPLGTYVEDYEWLASNGGDLDQYNGRFCVTPEYPLGTYAYFVTVDASGNAAFPYYVGIYYYGAPVTANFPTTPGSLSNGITIPASATIYTGGNPLAIRLLNFSGGTDGSTNRLDWRIVKSESLAGTTIERSEDGQRFNAIGDVLPMRTTGVANEVYTFVDDQPAPVSYYRLRMKEQSGELTFSAVAVVRRESPHSLIVYPSVAAQAVQVHCDARATTAKVLVLDAFGRIMFSQAVPPAESLTGIDVSAFASGMYLVRLEAGSTIETARFFKQ